MKCANCGYDNVWTPQTSQEVDHDFKEEEPMFEKAKVGDRVWSIRHGWGTVTSNFFGRSNPYVLSILFLDRDGDERYIGYTVDGRENHNDEFPSLFWDEVKITPPLRPKRKVKKVVEGWVNLYAPRYCAPGKAMGPIYETEGQADKAASDNRLGRAKFIEHEYEVDE